MGTNWKSYPKREAEGLPRAKASRLLVRGKGQRGPLLLQKAKQELHGRSQLQGDKSPEAILWQSKRGRAMAMEHPEICSEERVRQGKAEGRG